jgi:phosphohistidine phosphatase SixA
LVLSNSLGANEESSMIFLVRHAEKLADGEDPGLSTAGMQRAEKLAVLLDDAEITGIYSTDYIRTRDTAAPLARAEDLEIKLYDPSKPEQLIDLLSNKTGRYLVVGHSNTTPDLVKRLGGTPGPAIDEKTEYNRLYIVTRDDSGKATSVLLRY